MYLLINKCVTAVKVSNFSGHYLRNRSTLDIGVLGYIGIVQHKEHPPEVLHIPPGTPCIAYILVSLPGLMFVISILLFLFVSANACIRPISHCHLLLLPVYFKSYLSTAWNQQLLQCCWICYIAIYISVCVMWHKGTSVYISYCQLQQVTQQHLKPN